MTPWFYERFGVQHFRIADVNDNRVTTEWDEAQARAVVHEHNRQIAEQGERVGGDSFVEAIRNNRAPGLLPGVLGPERVHVLLEGRPLCGFDNRAPIFWPDGHRWLGALEAMVAAPPKERGAEWCPGCLAAQHRVRREAPLLPGIAAPPPAPQAGVQGPSLALPIDYAAWPERAREAARYALNDSLTCRWEAPLTDEDADQVLTQLWGSIVDGGPEPF